MEVKKSSKVIFAEQVAKLIQEDFGFRWIKAMEMAMSAVLQIEDVSKADINEVYKQVKKDINSGKID